MPSKDEFDRAALSFTDKDNTKFDNPGGIDLNPVHLDLQIKRNGKGVPLPLDQQIFENIHIEGLIPIIINISTITKLPLLGINSKGLNNNADP